MVTRCLDFYGTVSGFSVDVTVSGFRNGMYIKKFTYHFLNIAIPISPLYYYILQMA